MSVLLDTGVLYAYLNRQDAHHQAALDLVRRISDKEFGVPHVTDLVAGELFTLIRVRTASSSLEEAAKRLLPLPFPALKGLSTISLGPALLEPTWHVFRKYRDQGLSFTDASLIVTMRELRITWMATLDARLQSLVPFAA